MKAFKVLALFLVSAAAAHAAGVTTAPTPATSAAGVPVETVKVTDQDRGLFERVTETYLRAEKNGQLATVAPSETR